MVWIPAILLAGMVVAGVVGWGLLRLAPPTAAATATRRASTLLGATAGVAFFALLLGTVGLFFASTRLAGMLTLAAGLGGLLFFLHAWLLSASLVRDPDYREYFRRRVSMDLVVMLVVALSLPLAILAVGSWSVHTTGSYARHHGTLTTALPPDSCTVTTHTRRGRFVDCSEGWTWTVAGRQVQGRVHGIILDQRDLLVHEIVRGLEPVQVYVVGDKAFTENSAAPGGPLVALGQIPPRLGWLFLVVLVGLAWAGHRMKEWPSEDRAEASK